MKLNPFTFARETVEESKQEKVFFASFLHLYGYLCFVTIALGLLFFLFLAGGAGFARLWDFLLWASWRHLLFFPASLLLTWAYRVRVKSEGIHGGTFWSTPVYMTFAEMEEVTSRTVLGLQYLRIQSFRKSCPTLWLPLFLAKPEAFREEVATHTSSLNPLRRSLEDNNTPQKRPAKIPHV